MKIVHLVQYFQPGYIGGIQRYVAELAHCQQQSGQDVSIFTVELPHRTGGANPLRECLPGQSTVAVTARRAWGTLLRTPIYPPFFGDMRSLEADVVHVHGPTPWFDLALLTARPRWRRMILTIHNTFPASSRIQRSLGRLGKHIFMKTINRSDIVIAPHWPFVKELVGTAEAHSMAHKLRIVPPGVNHEHFRPLNLPRDPRSVLFVAHIRPEKGLHVLIEAMKWLPDLTLVVLGSVSYEQGYFDQVRADALRSLGDRVRFVLNPSPSQLLEAYNRAACVVAPSLGLESWNLVLLEAACTGAACVRTDLPGLAWADFALTVPAGEVVELAQGIQQAVTGRVELGAKARDAATQFSWQRTHRGSMAAYQTALSHA